MNDIWYHGSNHKITVFSNEFVGAEEATDQEGPGIYFTSDQGDARGYGQYVYQVTLSPKKLVSTKNGQANKLQLERLIKMSPDWKEDAQNWDENPSRGLRMAIESNLDYNDTPHEQFQQIWIDFFRYKPKDYIKGMIQLGYSGVIVNKENNRKHFIVFDPSIIKIARVSENITNMRSILKSIFLESENDDNVLNKIIDICKDIGSKEVAFYKVIDYIQQNVPASQKFAKQRNIESTADWKKFITNLHKKVRAGVKSDRKKISNSDMIDFHYDNIKRMVDKYKD